MENINTYYINLDQRTDRKNEIEIVIKNLGIKNYSRIGSRGNEYPDDNALGTLISHIRCLNEGIKNNYDKICILEDDFILLNENYKNLKLPEFKYDVYMLGGSIQKWEKYDENYNRILRSVRSEGYIVCNHYYQTLKDIYIEGVSKLLNKVWYIYHCDVIWNKLQKKDLWLVHNSGLIGGQKKGYSDLQKRTVGYQNFKKFKNNKSY